MLNASASHRQPVEPGEDEHSTPRVLVILALVLERLVERNERLLVVDGDGLMGRSKAANGPGSGSSSTHQMMGKSVKVFDGVRSPSISIPKYLQRMYKYTKCSPSCFVVAYVYIDRLVHRHPQLLLVSLNVHRLLAVSVMVASKMLDDEHFDNAFYARVGGVSNTEMNRLELELLFLLDFGVTVTAPEFEIYCFYLEREMSRLSPDGVTDLPSSVLGSAASSPTITVDDDEDDDGIHEFEVQLS